MRHATILMLPGWGNSGPEHWQTFWEAEHGYERVVQSEWDSPRLEDWVARLHARIVADDAPKVLVAHSLACLLVAHWSRARTGPVTSALLVGPSDVEAPGFPAGPSGFAPMPLWHLAFPSLVVASADDPYLSVERGRQFAQAWGSEHVLLGPRGHLGGAAGLGSWAEGQALLQRLTS
jgi:predicted alpha/beta hydrolase family esterase